MVQIILLSEDFGLKPTIQPQTCAVLPMTGLQLASIQCLQKGLREKQIRWHLAGEKGSFSRGQWLKKRSVCFGQMDLRLDDGSGKASWQFPKECLELEINDYQSQTVSALYFHSCGDGLSCFIAYRITGVYLFVIPRDDNKKNRD